VKLGFESLSNKQQARALELKEASDGIKDTINEEFRLKARKMAVSQDDNDNRTQKELLQAAVDQLITDYGERLYNPLFRLECELLLSYPICARDLTPNPTV
jgi:hypothetical protein